MPNTAESDLLLIWKFICISSFSRIFTHMWTVQYSCTSLAADIGAFCLVDVPSLYVLPCLHLVNQILAVASSIPWEDSCSKRCCLFGDRYLYLWASVSMSWDSAFPAIVASWLPTGGNIASSALSSSTASSTQICLSYGSTKGMDRLMTRENISDLSADYPRISSLTPRTRSGASFMVGRMKNVIVRQLD